MNARLLAIAAAAAATLAGCTIDNDASVRIFEMCSPPAPVDGFCTYTPTCGTGWLGAVRADVASNSPNGPLIWPVQVDNQRPDNSDRSGGVDTAVAWVEGYKISYALSGLPGLVPVPDVDVAISRSPIPSAGSSVVIAPIVPAAVGTLLFGQMATGDVVNVTAKLKAYGHYGDGSKFETGEFQVVARLEKGTFASPYNDATGTSAVCTALDATKPVYAGSCPQPFQTAKMSCVAATAN